MRNLGIIVAISTLSACTGGIVANVMPGIPVTIQGTPFTVTETSRGVQVRNFETGRTDPEVLILRAGLAAQQVTGCTVSSITKQPQANTYDASIACPDA